MTIVKSNNADQLRLNFSSVTIATTLLANAIKQYDNQKQPSV